MTRPSDRFCQQFGNDVFDELFEALYTKLSKKEDTPPFEFVGISQINACNHSFLAIYTDPAGQEWSITGCDGDFGGSQIDDFSAKPLTFEEYRPTTYSFMPTKRLPPGLFKVYLQWREETWFKEKERGYNYDSFFAPGLKTSTHYSAWAESKGMKIASIDECNQYIELGPIS